MSFSVIEETSILKNYHLRNQAVWYLKQFLLVPYLWGGNDFSGFDCSGLIIEVLQAVEILPHDYDNTAQGLYLELKNKKVKRPSAGCLVFWFKDGKARHVEMLVDEFHVIGASGGGSTTGTREDAIRQNAFVKMRPIGYRGEGYKIIDPFKVDKS